MLTGALQAISRRQRQVVALRYLADLTEAEVAASLGISVNSVKKHGSRGIDALRVSDWAPNGRRRTLPWNDNGRPAPERSPQELLELVRSKADAMRRRRRSVGAGAAAMLMLFALPLLSTVGREAPETSLSAVGPPTTSTVGGATVTTIEGAAATPPGGDEPTTTTTTEGSSSSQTRSSTLAKDGKRRPRPATTDATTTTFGQQATSTSTTTTCRNSTDPACGPVYWDPPPEPIAGAHGSSEGEFTLVATQFPGRNSGQTYSPRILDRHPAPRSGARR